MLGGRYVCDGGNHALRVVCDGFNTVKTLAGSGSSGYNDGEASQALLHAPASVDLLNCCFTHEASVVIADAGNHCIRLVSQGV